MFPIDRIGIAYIARYLIINPLALVFRPVRPFVDTMAVFLAVGVLAAICRAVGPVFFSVAVLQVIEPVTIIRSPIFMRKLPLSIRLIVSPFTY